MRRKSIVRREPVAESALNIGSDLLKRVLANRGVLEESSLARSLTELLSPASMKGLPEAVELVSRHIKSSSRILIVGDFDCDGATSVALGMLALPAMGAAQVDYLVPNRFEYGYGLTPEIVDVAQQKQPDLIITVDNGISSIEGVRAAKQLGWDVLVTDHHLPADELPLADAIVNPNQPGCLFESKNLAGVGVLFYLLVALRRRLVDDGWFETRGLAQVNLANWLDIVALGTVADVVPLDRNNRLLVAQGIARINRGHCRPGISALLEVAKREKEHVRASDIGFALGPRLNAAGRLDDISVGIRCLLTDRMDEAKALAAQLNQFNVERREIEQGMQQEADAIVESLSLKGALPLGLCVYQADWHAGVVGIVASRLKERYYRPTIVFAQERPGVLKGSGRSIPGVHLRDMLDLVAKRRPDVLSKFGGHAMAAGLSLNETHLSDFETTFSAILAEQADPCLFDESLMTDGELSSEQLDVHHARELEGAVPWGQSFPEPSFDGEFWLLSTRVLGAKHLKMTVAPKNNPQYIIDAIAFGVVDSQGLHPAAGAQRVKLVYKLNINRWRGNESVQLMVDYLEPVWSS